MEPARLVTAEEPLPQTLDSQACTPADAPNTTPSQDNHNPPAFSIFTKKEKWALVAITSLAGLFSPLSGSIYFPAIPNLAQEFGVSISLINLTVTVYMIAQGISPVLWAPLADTKGRRPVYLACLFLLSLSCVGLALVPTNAWWLLMVLRFFQSSGSASTVALGAGVVSDIVMPAERGGFIGLSFAGAMLGPCFGPILGGILAGELGWRWIFWFLCILSSSCLIFVLLVFPETLRRAVGNGSAQSPWWNRPLIPIIGPHRRHRTSADVESTSPSPPPASTTARPEKPSNRPNMNPFRLFANPDIIVILIASGAVYALFMCIPATTASIFQRAYPHLTQTEIGVCFLPMGIGGIIGTFATGKLQDRSYKIAREKWEGHGDEPKSEHLFHIEKARLSITMIYLAGVVVFSIGYGWCVSDGGPLAVSLILQFLIGWGSIGVVNSFQTLLMDLFPKQGSSITALNNLVRCTLGAAIISVIDLLMKAIGDGWTFVLLAGIVAIITPSLTLLEIRRGPKWRLRRVGLAETMQEGQR